MERIVYLVDAVRERLLAFYKSVGTPPKHIIIYRYYLELNIFEFPYDS